MFILYYYIIVWEVMSTTMCGVFEHVAQKYAKNAPKTGAFSLLCLNPQMHAGKALASARIAKRNVQISSK